MSRQEKLASWQQLRADERSTNVFPDPKAVKPETALPIKSKETPTEELIALDPVVQEPVLQKFGKKKKAEDTE